MSQAKDSGLGCIAGLIIIFAANTAVLVGLWAGIVERSWPLRITTAAFLLPYGVFTVLAYPVLRALLLPKSRLEKKPRWRHPRDWVKILDESKKKWNKAAPSAFLDLLETLLVSIRFALYLPVLMCQIAWVARNERSLERPKRLRETEWSLFLLSGAFYLAASHMPMVGLVIAGAIILSSSQIAWEPFGMKEGVANIWRWSPHSITVAFIPRLIVVMVVGFAVVHFSLSRLDSNTYTAHLSVLDSLYFSTITFGTVGYGDIFPKLRAGKLACMLEVGSGMLVLILGVGVVTSVWLGRHHPKEPEFADEEGTGNK